MPIKLQTFIGKALGVDYYPQYPITFGCEVTAPEFVFGVLGIKDWEVCNWTYVYAFGSGKPTITAPYNTLYWDGTVDSSEEGTFYYQATSPIGNNWKEHTDKEWLSIYNRVIRNATDGKLYGYIPKYGSYTMRQIYSKCHLLVRLNDAKSGNILYDSGEDWIDMSSGSVTITGTINKEIGELDKLYKNIATLYFCVEYKTSDGRYAYPKYKIDYEETSDKMYGKYSTGLKTEMVILSADVKQLPAVTGDEYTIIAKVDDEIYLSPIMIRTDAEYGLSVYGFNILIVNTSGQEFSITQAIQAGIITLTYRRYVFRHAELHVRFKIEGYWTFRVTYFNYMRSDGYAISHHVDVSVNVYSLPTVKLELNKDKCTGSPNLLGEPTGYPGGLAPYTAWFDDKSTFGSNPLKITSILFDFGDNRSDSIIYPKDSSGNPKTGTSQTHKYVNYYQKRAALVYDCAGNHRYVSYCAFTPDVTQRVITSPVIQHSKNKSWHTPEASEETGIRPDVVACGASPAGIPLPYIEWKISRPESAGGQHGQYGVTKSGKFAEFALPVVGDFQLEFRVYSDSTKSAELTKYQKDVTLTVPVNEVNYRLLDKSDTEIPALLPKLETFTVWVINSNGVRVDVLKPARIQYTESWSDNDYVEFDVYRGYQYIGCLNPGNKLLVGYLGLARIMIITEYNEDNETVTIVAQDAASYAMGGRVALLSTHSTVGNGYDYQISPAESMLQYFPISNIIEEGRTNNELVILGKNQERGGKCVYSARYNQILDVIRDVCADTELGYTSALYEENKSGETTSLVCGMWIRKGTDRTSGTGRVVFDELNFKTAKVGNYRQFTSPNLAITAGAGSGNTREYKEYIQGSGDMPTGMNRNEVFVDAGDSADTDEQKRMGLLELIKSKMNSITVYPNLENSSCVFGKDYNVGDKVIVITRSGFTLQKVITDAKYSRDETGVHLELECGDDMKGYRFMIRQNKLQNTYARK